VDVTATLDAALGSRDPVAAIEALAPGSAGYLALRQALRRLRNAGAPGQGTAERLRAVEANLERQRWLPRHLPADRIWVDITGQSLTLYRDDRAAFTTRVVVGSEGATRQTPEFHTVIDAAYLNPPWLIPEDIVRTAIIPRLERDPDYLTRRNITLRPDGEAEQAPGPDSGLGAILFDMPNRFDVYLHDTPDRSIFARADRRLSNGCIRVENPLELASLMMEMPLEALHGKVATGETRREDMHRPMPVFLVYQTAVMTPGRDVAFREDFYARDGAVWRSLQAQR
jgi:murein L,D-transpeptidase YcbB/YkuD